MACHRLTLDRLGVVRLFAVLAVVSFMLAGCRSDDNPTAAMEIVDDSVVTHVFPCPGELVEKVEVWEFKGDLSHLDDPPIWEIRAVAESMIERIIIGVEPVGFETVVALERPVPPSIVVTIHMTTGYVLGGGPLADYPSNGNVLSAETDEIMTLDEWRTGEREYCRRLDEQRRRGGFRLP